MWIPSITRSHSFFIHLHILHSCSYLLFHIFLHLSHSKFTFIFSSFTLKNFPFIFKKIPRTHSYLDYFIHSLIHSSLSLLSVFSSSFISFIPIMARSWFIDMGGFAKKVKRTTLSLADQIKDCGAYRECPNCHCRIDNSDVSSEWPGFPIGIR